MKQVVTRAIVLHRINYAEADRILTLLTPEHGKLRLMAKGVRKQKSKLAGGIELFSVSDITFVRGRGDIGTLVSARLDTHYSGILADIERTMAGYDTIKAVHKSTEDELEVAYFELVHTAFRALNTPAITPQLVRIWCLAQLLELGGYRPELGVDNANNSLEASKRYELDMDTHAFIPRDNGRYDSDRIKLLRVLFSPTHPEVIQRIQGASVLLPDCHAYVQLLAKQYLRV